LNHDLSHRELLLLKKVANSPSQKISKTALIGKDEDNAARIERLLILRLIAYCDKDYLMDSEGFPVQDEAGNIIPSHICIMPNGKDVIEEYDLKRRGSRNNRLINFGFTILGMIFGFLLNKYGNVVLALLFPSN
jgi:hypothetical protein